MSFLTDLLIPGGIGFVAGYHGEYILLLQIL